MTRDKTSGVLHRVFGIGVALAVVASASMAAAPAQAASAVRSQWYLQQFDVTAAWQLANGAGVTVADIGSGVDTTQTDITGTLLPEIDFSTGSPIVAQGDAQGDDSTDYVSTNAAVLITGSGHGSAGVEGIAPGAKILPIRDAESPTLPDPAHVAGAIEYAVNKGAKIVLMPGTLASDSQLVVAAVRYAVTHNAIVVTATGNNGKNGNSISSPCDSAGALCVSGTDQNGVIWPYSSTGPAVNLAAPAVNLPIAVRGGGGLDSSTHYSAALAAGAAALVWSAHPKWSAGQVIRALIDTTTDGDAAHARVNSQIGYGIINPYAAMRATAPAAVTNPFLPLALVATAPVVTKTSAKPQAGAKPAATGGGAGRWLEAGGAVVATIVGVGLIWWVIRRRTRSGNYLTDPGYGAGTYYQPNYEPSATTPISQFPAQSQYPAPAPQPGSPAPVADPEGSAEEPTIDTAGQPFYQQAQPLPPQPQPTPPAPTTPRYSPPPLSPGYDAGDSPGPVWGEPPSERRSTGQ
jgi:Subtilase family